jgi:hypothetical protein
MFYERVFILVGKPISPDAQSNTTANTERQEAPTPAEPSSTR